MGSATLASCAGEQFVEVKGTVTPDFITPPEPTLGAGEFADTVLFNGDLITMDKNIPSAKAIAVKGDKILIVGRDAEVKALAGESTQMIDLKGKTITPGLIDAHNHMQVWGTLMNNFIPLLPPEVTSLDKMLVKIKEAVAQANPGEWVQFYYWMIDPLPTIKELDPISPDNPLWLMHQAGHLGIANSAALKIAGITVDTEAPEGSVIERDANGELTGAFYNHKAMDLVRIYMPEVDTGNILNNIALAETLMSAEGVTSFHDCNARFSALQAYMQAGREHAMTLRGQVFYTLEWPADLERALNEMQAYTDDYMRFAGYKFLIDGQLPTFYTHEPHAGVRWDMPTWEPKLFKETIRQLHDTGLQISVHCGGDAAVDLTLEAYEEAMNANPRPDPRHRIEHAVITKPHATEKAADLGVHISCQPQFIRLYTRAAEIIGEERLERIKVTREWLDAGINLALGSDVPTTPWHEPQITLKAAVTRLALDNEPFFPEQAMTIEEALYAHTMGSAKAAFDENIKGSLTPGKLADLVVWDENYYTIKPKYISEVKALTTMVGGKIVHQA
ncbi:amidohydrolase [Chloroflexota bacterium]